MNSLVNLVEEALAEVPALDIHTHLVGGRLGARGPHDVLLYYMMVSDLYAGGCPSGARLSQDPAWPSEAEAKARIEEALPILPAIQYTSSFWAVRVILRDLYNWEQPITAGPWRKLDALILPANKQVGFFSDASCLEWTYGKTILVRRPLARVLAERIDQGQYSLADALKIAEAILYHSPQHSLGMLPSKPKVSDRPHPHQP